MRSSRADRRILAVFVGTLAMAAATWGVPRGLLGLVTRSALACLDDDVAAEASATCDVAEARLARLADVPWVHHEATYRYEELRARRALQAYTEAAVGAPDPEARSRAAARIAQHEDFVDEGSQRLRLEELGRPVGAPQLGVAALELGDRTTLLERFDSFGAWQVRLAALRAALQEGDLAKAETIAARYAEFDPRDADLRTAVGAVLCLGSDPGRGLEVLARVPGDRAEKRYAAMARNFGEVRRVQEACAALAGIEPPPLPIDREAGVPDAEEARATLALRLAEGDLEEREAIATAKRLLTGPPPPAGAGLSLRVRGARKALIAQLLEIDDTIDAATLSGLAEARDLGEAPLLPTRPVDAERVLAAPLGDTPYVAPETFARSAERVAELAGKASASRPLPPAASLRLEQLATALHLEASLAFARGADLARARAEASAAGRALPPTAAALLRANVAVVAGDPLLASAEAAAHPGDVALALAEALAAVASGQLDGATAALARAQASREPLSAELAAHLRLWDLAVGEPAGGAVPTAARMDSWVGFAEPRGRWRAQGVAARIALDPLAEAILTALPSDRRRARRAFLARRGDAPDALVPWVLALSRLAPAQGSSGAVETWLDAALALDEVRFSMREIAFARALGARARRDEASAKRWTEVRAVLRHLYADPRRAEIALFLGL